MKYQSELIKDILEERGHEKPSLHYESECIETWIEENKGAYPKLCDYQGEWLNYIVENPIGVFPYETITDVTEATVNNVVPFAFKSATLKGSTKYRDIDTGEFLETFEEGRNLELVSVKLPVLMTRNNLNLLDTNPNSWISTTNAVETKHNIIVSPNKVYSFHNLRGAWVDIVPYNDRGDEISKLVSINGAIGATKTVFTTPNDCASLKVILKLTTNTTEPNHNKLRLFEGETDLGYPPYSEVYKSNILTVNEDVELRGVGDVKDELDCLTGEVIERIGEIVLDGSENWTANFSTDTTILYSVFLNNINKKVGIDNIICDRFITENTYNNNTDKESIFGSVSNQSVIYIRISKNKIVSEDNNGIKAWLSQNPITIQHQLETESVKTVALTVINQDGETLSKFKPLEGTMNITTNGTPIKPSVSMEIPVEATNQNLMSFIEEE